MTSSGSVRQARGLASPLLGPTGVLCVWAFSYFVSQSSLMERDPELVTLAIFLDLTVTAAFAHWLFGVRLGRLPLWTVVPVAAFGLILAHSLLPTLPGNASIVAAVLAGLVEVGAVTAAILRYRRLSRTLRQHMRNGDGFFPALEEVFKGTLPRFPSLARWLRFELELWWLALAGWFIKVPPRPSAVSFSHHRSSGWSVVAFVVVFLLVVEAAVVHVWLTAVQWPTLQVVAILLHACSLLWVLGDAHGLRIYRSSVDSSTPEPLLRLRVGLRAELTAPLSAIAAIRVGQWQLPSNVPAVVVLGTPNVHITFDRAVTLKRLFGAIPVQELLLQVDDAANFVSAIVATPQSSK
jgi:hypothetical protein